MAEQDSGFIREIKIAVKTYFDKKSSQEIKKATDEVKKLAKETKKSGDEAGKSSGGFAKLLKSIGRIAFYRAIRSAIRAVTSSIREGIGNLYQWSKLLNESFSRNLDSLSTSVQYLKNGIAVGLAPVIEAFVPILVRVADAVAEFGNAVSMFFSALNGASTYRKAVKASTEFAKSVGTAYKEAKDFLFGFDELNVFNNEQSGGGSGSGVDYSNMFEEVKMPEFDELPEKMQKLVNFVRNVVAPAFEFLKDNILEVGVAIATAFGAIKFFDISPIFSKALIVVGLLAIGVVEIVKAFKEWNTTGEYSKEVAYRLAAGILAISAAISIVFGLIPILVGLIVSSVALIAYGIKENWNELKETAEVIGNNLKELGASIVNFFISIVNGFLIAWNNIVAALERGFNWVSKHIGKGKEFDFDSWQADLIEKIEVKGLKQVIKSPSKSASNANKDLTDSGFTSFTMGSTFDPNFFASGGFPSQGSLFWANENGPELVGQVGGRTAVTNQDQFTQGLADANEGVVNATYAMAGMIVEAIERKNLSVRIGDKEIGQANDRYTRQRGFANTIGVFANAI